MLYHCLSHKTHTHTQSHWSNEVGNARFPYAFHRSASLRVALRACIIGWERVSRDHELDNELSPTIYGRHGCSHPAAINCPRCFPSRNISGAFMYVNLHRFNYVFSRRIFCRGRQRQAGREGGRGIGRQMRTLRKYLSRRLSNVPRGEYSRARIFRGKDAEHKPRSCVPSRFTIASRHTSRTSKARCRWEPWLFSNRVAI